jgi:hypothetical protein
LGWVGFWLVDWFGWLVGWLVGGWLVGLVGWLVGIQMNVRHQRPFAPLTIKIHQHYTEILISNLTKNKVHFH